MQYGIFIYQEQRKIILYFRLGAGLIYLPFIRVIFFTSLVFKLRPHQLGNEEPASFTAYKFSPRRC